MSERPIERYVDDWRRLLERVTIRLPFKAGIGEIQCAPHSDDILVMLWFDALDSVTGKPNRFHSARIIPLRLGLADDRSRLMWLRAQWRDLLDHELDECLRVDGRMLRDPHLTINEQCPDHQACRIAHVVVGPPASYSCTTDSTKRVAANVWSPVEVEQ